MDVLIRLKLKYERVYGFFQR